MITTEEFFERLESLGVLAQEELQSLRDRAATDQTSSFADDVAARLVQSNRLTEFQAARLLEEATAPLRIGNYIIVGEVGRGGMGHVYRARHRKMKRDVALKILPKEAIGSRVALERFEREVEAAAKLVHPNIVTTYDADEADGVHFLVMELVPGGNLRSLVQRSGPLAVAQASSYVIQAARGLQTAHAMGVVHRDVKPSNLLLDEQGVVKVADFGLARLQAGPDGYTATRAQLTETRALLGTVDFLAPEQARNVKTADHRADIYSLGCTLYFLLTGKAIYPGKSLMQKVVSHQKHAVPRLSAVRDDVPKELEAVFRRMVAKEPGNRPQSMGEVAVGLLPFCASDDTVRSLGGTTETRPETAADSILGRPGRRRNLATVGLAIAVVVAIAAWPSWRREGDTDGPKHKQPPVADLLTGQANEPSPTDTLSSPVRRAAEHFLGRGAKLTIAAQDGATTLLSPGDLPDDPFRIIDVRLNDELTDDDVVRLRSLGNLRDVQLWLTDASVTPQSAALLNRLPAVRRLNVIWATDRSIQLLQRVESLSALLLEQPGVSEDGFARLREMASLKTLELVSDVEVTSAAGLHALTNLDVLKLVNTGLSRPAVAMIHDALPACRIEYDELGMDGANREAAQWVLSHNGTLLVKATDGLLVEVASVKDLPSESLRVIQVSLAGAGDIIDEELAALGGLTCLERLNLAGSLTSAGELTHLEDLWALHTLDLSSTAVGDAALRSVGRLTQLRVLRLAVTRVTDAGLEHLAPLNALQALDLAETSVSEAGLAALRSKQSLRHLNVSDTELGDSFFNLLPSFPNLEALNIAVYGAQFQGRRFGELASLAQLEELTVGRAAASVSVFRDVAKIAGLKRLGIGTPVTDEHLAVVASMPQLEQVTFYGGGMSEEALPELKRLEHLKTLVIGNGRFSMAAVDSLASFQQLRRLELRRARISEEAAARLVAALPSCKVVINRPAENLSEHDAAWWVLSVGGHLEVRMGSESIKVTDLEQLPEERFSVRAVTIEGNPSVNDAGLASLKSLTKLSQLRIVACPGVTSEGIRHLSSLGTLIHVALDQTNVGDEGARFLLRNQRLTSLSMWDTPVTDAVMEAVVQFPRLRNVQIFSSSDRFAAAAFAKLASLPHLTQLGVGTEAITAENAAALLSMSKLRSVRLGGHLSDGQLRLVAQLPLVRDVTLRGCQASAGGLALLHRMPSLTTLRIEQELDDTAAAGLKSLTQLSLLHLQDTAVTSAKVIDLQQSLPNCRVVYDAERLDGANRRAAEWVMERGGRLLTDLSPDYVASIDELPRGPLRVQVIRLDDVPGVIDDDLVRLRDLTRLQQLYLRGTSVTGAGLRHIGGLVELKRLDLVGIKVDDQELRHISRLVQLRHLGLGSTAIGDDGLLHLAHLRQLVALGLERTKTTDIGLSRLSGLSNLRWVGLRDTRVSDEGLVNLSDKRGLQELFLNRTDVSDAGLQHLYSIPRLRLLHLEGTACSPDGVAALQRALPYCNIIHPSISAEERPDQRATLAMLRQGAAVDLRCMPGGDITATELGDLPRGILNLLGVSIEDPETGPIDLSSLRGLWLLGQVQLRGVQLGDGGLEPLASCPELEELTLQGIALTEEHIEDLKRMGALTRLVLDGARIAGESVDSIRAALPNCRVTVLGP